MCLLMVRSVKSAIAFRSPMLRFVNDLPSADTANLAMVGIAGSSLQQRVRQRIGRRGSRMSVENPFDDFGDAMGGRVENVLIGGPRRAGVGSGLRAAVVMVCAFWFLCSILSRQFDCNLSAHGKRSDAPLRLGVRTAGHDGFTELCYPRNVRIEAFHGGRRMVTLFLEIYRAVPQHPPAFKVETPTTIAPSLDRQPPIRPKTTMLRPNPAQTSARERSDVLSAASPPKFAPARPGKPLSTNFGVWVD